MIRVPGFGLANVFADPRGFSATSSASRLA
jgi:hypothetical protein